MNFQQALCCSAAHTRPDNCANTRRYSSRWNVAKNTKQCGNIWISEAAFSSVTYQTPRSLGYCEHSVPQWRRSQALVVLYLRHAFVPVTDSPSGWSVLDLIAVYMWRCRKRKTEHILHSSSFSWWSCILPAVGKYKKLNKKHFYITEENIESVKDGTFKGPISDRYYCVVLDVYLPCTAVLL